MAAEQNTIHNLILENKEKLSISGVSDVDTFDEGKIILFTEDDTLIVEGEELHIQKLDVANGELIIEGTIYAIQYTGDGSTATQITVNIIHGFRVFVKGFFKKMLK